MGNAVSLASAIVSSVAGIYGLMAWKDAPAPAKKWLGIGSVVCLIPALIIVGAVILAIFTLGLSLVLLSVLALAGILLIIGAGFLIYGTLLLASIKVRSQNENKALKNAIIASIIAGTGGFLILISFLLKVSKH